MNLNINLDRFFHSGFRYLLSGLLGLVVGYIASYFCQPGLFTTFVPLANYVVAAPDILLPESHLTSNEIRDKFEQSIAMTAWFCSLLGFGIGVVGLTLINKRRPQNKDDQRRELPAIEPAGPKPAELRREADRIGRCILRLVFGAGPDLPQLESITQFNSQYVVHDQQVNHLRQRSQTINRAKAELTTLASEKRQRLKEVETARSELSRLARPLGTSAFSAFVSGKIPQHPSFEKRQKLEEQLIVLQKQHDELLPSVEAGIVDKSKSKIRQLAVLGQMKLEQLKIAGLETEIGDSLINNQDEDSARCDSTSALLVQIVSARSQISDCIRLLDRTDQSIRAKQDEVCANLQIASCDHNSLESELDKCFAGLLANELSKLILRRELLRALSADGAIAMDTPLGELCGSYRSAMKSLIQTYPNAGTEPNADKEVLLEDLKAHLGLIYAEVGRSVFVEGKWADEFTGLFKQATEAASPIQSVAVFEKLGHKAFDKHGKDTTAIPLFAPIIDLKTTISELDGSVLLGSKWSENVTSIVSSLKKALKV